MPKNLEHDRIQAIDFVKGIDIIFMVLFNYSITLDYFNLIIIPSNYLYRYHTSCFYRFCFYIHIRCYSLCKLSKTKGKSNKEVFNTGDEASFLCNINNIIHLCFCTPEYNIFRNTAFLRCCLFSHTGFHKV